MPAERCDHCPGRTPLRPDPANLQRARELQFEPPLDEGIREIVITLIANDVETFESCEGGDGHSFPVGMTFLPSKDSPRWAAGDTAARYAAQKENE